MTADQPRYIVTRSDGTPIPPGEPCFVIRAQDAFAVRAVEAYIELTRGIVSPAVTVDLIEHLQRLQDWRVAYPVKIPD
jgi:hypothetical protein